MIDAGAVQRMADVVVDTAARGAPLLVALALAGCVTAAIAAFILIATRRSSFATRATALHACTLLLLVFTAARALPRDAASRASEAAPQTRRLAWTLAPNIPAPHVVERARDASRNNGIAHNVSAAAILLWASGVIFALQQMLRGAGQLAAIRRRTRISWTSAEHARAWCSTAAGARMPAVLVSDEIDIPFVCGWLEPAIIVPATSDSWTAREWQMVLLHESSHIARGDVLMQWVRQVALALHWFNPAVHWFVQRADEACEGACDDVVLLRGADAARYATALLSFAEGSWMYDAAPSPTIVGRSGLERRVRAMVDVGRRRRSFGIADRLVPRMAGFGGGILLAVVWPRLVFAVAGPVTRASLAPSEPNVAAPAVSRSPLRAPARRAASPVTARDTQTTSDTTDALIGLGAALHDVNPIVRDAAARALSSWRSSASLARLRRIAESDDSRRDDARAALSEMESHR